MRYKFNNLGKFVYDQLSLEAKVMVHICKGLVDDEDEVEQDDAERVLRRLLGKYGTDAAILAAFDRAEIRVLDYL